MRGLRPIVIGIALALLGASLTLAMPGCSMRYEFEIEGAIKSSSDGTPLANVQVTLEAPDSYGWPEALKTDKDGKFTGTFKIKTEALSDEMVALPTWRLRFTRDGYQDESIDVSLRKRPEFRQKAPRTIVLAHMSAKKG